MKLSKTAIIYTSIFFIFYLSLVFGFLIGEDSSGGSIQDYTIHLGALDFFLEDTLYGLRNYLDINAKGGVHSPIFIVFLKYLTLYDDTIGRFFFLNLCILIPIIFYITLKNKIKIDIFLIFYLSNFFFISPYFRSTAIWPGDENLAILLFISSIYFYIKFLNTDSQTSKMNYMICNIIMIAIASYFRPVYCFFSFFYFYEFVIKNFKLNFFLIYLLLSALLAFPAFYYVFILKVTFFYEVVGSFNIANSVSLSYTALLFYLIPFIFVSIRHYDNFKLNNINLFFTLFFSIIVFKFFDYQTSTGGGPFYMLQNLFFKGNLFLTIIFALSFYFTNQLLEVHKIKNFILLLILLFFELDNHFYMESFDPLFLICIFLLFDIKIIDVFFTGNILRKVNFLFIFLFLFYLVKIIHLYL